MLLALGKYELNIERSQADMPRMLCARASWRTNWRMGMREVRVRSVEGETRQIQANAGKHSQKGLR